MTHKLAFKKASKSSSKLRAALFGPSGAGKTFTALRIATGLGGRIAVIDTERGSASKYADRFAFDVLDLERTAIPDYQAAISAAAEAGYAVLLIDSLSHGWQDLLQEVDRLANAKYRGNTWSAWSEGTPKQRGLVDAILTYPGHVIATMRSRTEWSIEDTGKGKTKPVRVGLAPEQGKGIEYEFDMLLELSQHHTGTVIKDRTGKFQDQILDKPGEEFGRALADWLATGTTPAPAKAVLRPVLVEPANNGAQDQDIDPAMAAAIEEEVRLKVDKLVERCRAAGAWDRADEYAQARFTGAHLTYARAELEAARKAANDPAQAAIDEAKATAKAA